MEHTIYQDYKRSNESDKAANSSMTMKQISKVVIRESDREIFSGKTSPFGGLSSDQPFVLGNGFKKDNELQNNSIATSFQTIKAQVYNTNSKQNPFENKNESLIRTSFETEAYKKINQPTSAQYS